MSKKDVLHVPPEAVPTAPDRQAGHEDHDHPAPAPLRPDAGPAGTPGEGGNPRIIEPVTTPGTNYPGVGVT